VNVGLGTAPAGRGLVSTPLQIEEEADELVS
jgi:hypothetical protein